MVGTLRALVPGVATPRLMARLAGPDRDATVVHRGKHALYLDVDGWCLGVVSACAVALPCALRTTLTELGPLAEFEQARLVGGQCFLDDTEIRVGRLQDLSVPKLEDPAPWCAGLLRAAAAAAAAEVGVLLDQPLVTLIGHGSGLTPLADDVLCGWLAVGHALGHPDLQVPDARPHTTLLSATLIDCAAHGEVLPEFSTLIRALRRNRRDAVRHAADRLASVGHSSGAGLLLGAALRLEACAAAGKDTGDGRGDAA